MRWDSWVWIAAFMMVVRRRGVLGNWKFLLLTPKKITIKD